MKPFQIKLIYRRHIIHTLVYQKKISKLNEPKVKVVTIPRLILLIIDLLKQKEITNTIINCEQIYYADQNKIFQNFDSSITKLKQYDELGKQISDLSSQYYSLIKEGISSGLIILSKKKEIDTMKDKLLLIEKSILDYNNYFLMQGNSLLIKKFTRFPTFLFF